MDLAQGHETWVILCDGAQAGFVHICMRDPVVCWIEDIFVREELRRRGIASAAIGLVEKIQRGHESIEGVCMDVMPDNLTALRLYSRLGYDWLSLLTVRKEKRPYEIARTEKIGGPEFQVKKL